MSWGVILPGWAEMEVGERVTEGVVFINSLLVPFSHTGQIFLRVI